MRAVLPEDTEKRWVRVMDTTHKPRRARFVVRNNRYRLAGRCVAAFRLTEETEERKGDKGGHAIRN
ncbi:MAG: hypothetical protein LC126_22195 [Bryobacterales bacterium]|nr:hypothetical protein [Bryobacterales bacterium]